MSQDSTSADPNPPATGHSAPWRMAEHWPELVAAITDQSVESVGLLMRGLDLLVHRGRLTPAEYKVLALPAERLRHVSMSAQQIVRFQSGQVRQSHEKIDLAYLLECVLQERRNALAMMGITVWRKFVPVDILIDPTLGFSLTQAMLDWCAPFGNRIDLRLEVSIGTPPQARLWIKTYTEQAPTQSTVFEDNIHWLLLRQIAATDGGIEVDRTVTPDGVVLTAAFKRTLAQAQPTPAPESDRPLAMSDSRFHSISGAHVLVVLRDDATRNESLDIIRHLGVTVDGAADSAQARSAMQAQEPHLIVLDGEAHDADNALLRDTLAREHPLLPVVEIIGAGQPTRSHESRPRIARDALRQSLGSAVMFTLSKVMEA